MKKNDNNLFYTCSLIELIGRTARQKRKDVVNLMGEKIIRHIYHHADTLHCEPIAKIADYYIDFCHIPTGEFDNIASCKYTVPSYWDIGKVYARLIEDIQKDDVIFALIQVYNSTVSDSISYYNSDFFYQPRGFIKEQFLSEGNAVGEKTLKKPAIRFRGFTDAWEQREFENFAQRKSEMGNSSSAPCVEYEDIIADQGRLNKDVFQKRSHKTGIKFSAGDVLFGKLRPYLKNWLLPDFSGVAVGDFWVLKPSGTDSRFLYYLIQTSEFFSVSNQSAGSKMPRADWNLVSQYAFHIPGEENEQQKIGSLFRRIDALITLHQRKYDKLSKIKKSMLEKLFPKNGSNVPEIRFAGFTDAWEQREFENFAQRKSEMGNSSSAPCVEYEDIIADQGRLNKDVFQKRSHKTGIKFSAGDVLFGKLRPYLKNWLLPDFSGVAVGDFWVLKPSGTDSRFLYYLIQTSEFFSVSNQSAGSKMPRADWNLVSQYAFHIPGEENEQQKIGSLFRRIDALITLHQRELEKLRNIKKACLEKMFV